MSAFRVRVSEFRIIMIIVLVAEADPRQDRPSAVPIHATEIENGEEFGEWRRGKDREDESLREEISQYALSRSLGICTQHTFIGILGIRRDDRGKKCALGKWHPSLWRGKERSSPPNAAV